MNDLDDTSILSNIKERFQRKQIYTYASNVLISLNPYGTFDGLYGPREMDKYLAINTFSEQPPHVYAIANEALNNLRMHNKSQSILITGVSGSGKTENGKHIMELLCQTSVSSRNVSKAIPILEAFGNAKTRGNSNSSRFCKNVEYLPDKDLVLKPNEDTTFYSRFNIVDENLSGLGFTINNKKSIYIILAAILNLGNIQFESLTDDDSCNVTIASNIYLCNAAALLGVDERELADGLTSLTLEMGNQRIKSPLTTIASEKARDSLATGLYGKMFGQMMQIINNHLSSSSVNYSISILDIAGFDTAMKTLVFQCENPEDVPRLYEELLNIGGIKDWYPSQDPEISWQPGSVQFETFEQAFAVLTKGVSIKNLDDKLNDDCICEVIKYIDILHLIHFAQLNVRFKALTEISFLHPRIFPSTVGSMGLINFRYLLEMILFRCFQKMYIKDNS
ncbi:myosin heavy chain 95F-like [Sitodiplosis mosellana]|uniref:myosin heavy chain 95F-like n=1 Tax=Sitodiplosis mosellana TaxID=263140 RepID=UPI002444B29F|nr:myosin heavy chain 95F-like [Sitodiplosis mosellana]